jgi:hypothetical protein
MRRMSMKYNPKPINTANIELDLELTELTEKLAENAHDIWAIGRISEGWAYGTERNDKEKKHPCLIPYADLPESEKEYDRRTAMESIKAIITLGYKISKG